MVNDDNTDISFETLADYVFERLPAAEEEDVEQFLDKNPEYSDMVDGMLSFCLQYQLKSPEALIAKLEEQETSLYKALQSKAPSAAKPPTATLRNVRPRWHRWSIAAGFLLAISLAAYLLWPFSTDSAQVAKQSYQSDPISLSRQSLGGAASADSTEVFLIDIENKAITRMPAAIRYFSGLPEADLRFIEAQYFLGHAHFVAGTYSQAIFHFEKYLSLIDPKARGRYAGTYYLGLALLAAEQETQGRQQLQNIALEPEHLYRPKAIELLENL